VILSGGSGARGYGLCRVHYPRAVSAAGRRPQLLQFAALLVIANEEHRFLIAEQLREVGASPQTLLLEPGGRNTAPAVCVAALRLAERDLAALMLMTPLDHKSTTSQPFSAMERGAAAARAGFLVTFGVTRSAETGYGYIERSKPRRLCRLPGRLDRLRGYGATPLAQRWCR
jgi:mannose-1-phosphate guanylyltransferase/mannose-6-phosphate isomerase